MLDLQRDLPFLWCGTRISAWIAAFEARAIGIRGRLKGMGIDPGITDRMTIAALRDIAALRPELAGHVRSVHLSVLLGRCERGEPIDGLSDTIVTRPPRSDERSETGRMIGRHGGIPPHGIRLSDATLARHRTAWEPFEAGFADLITAPLAAADHAAGINFLSSDELSRCRDASLFDPDYFETIVPMRTNAILERNAQLGD